MLASLQQDRAEAAALPIFPAAGANPELRILTDALMAERPSVQLNELESKGVLKERFPELQALVNLPQDSKWHPEGDAWVHTLMVVDQARQMIDSPLWSFGSMEKQALMLGVLFHDIGKALTTYRREDGRIVAPKHEEAGVEPARASLDRMGVGGQLANCILAVVAHHMRPPALYSELKKGHMTEAQYERAVHRTVRKLGDASWSVLLASAVADRRGRLTPEASEPALPFEQKFWDAARSFQG